MTSESKLHYLLDLKDDPSIQVYNEIIIYSPYAKIEEKIFSPWFSAHAL